MPTAFATHDFVVSSAIMPPEIETVNKTKTMESKTTILMVAEPRRNRLLVEILRISPDFEIGLNLFTAPKLKYCIGDNAFKGDSLAASRSGFTPNMSDNAKKEKKTNGTNQ
jgi:hypothetical protein